MFIFAWFVAGGIGHFALTDLFVSVTPSWTPFPRAVVLATGAAELAGAFALLWPPLRRVAGLALIAFAICVTPVHVEMLMQSERYRTLGEGVLWARLLFQPILIWIVWFATLAGRK